MGLDIYFYKTNKYDDCKSISEYYERGKEDHEKYIDDLIPKLVKELSETKKYSETYHKVFFDVLPMVAPCDIWLFEEYQEQEKPLEQTIQFLEDNLRDKLKTFWESAYFRKANFVYAYFKDKLEDECCFVTMDDLKDLTDRCKKIMDTDIYEYKLKMGLEEKNNQIEQSTNRLVALVGEGKDTSKEQQHLKELKAKKEQTEKELKDIEGKTGNCEKLLPTRSGFFFGSTDYDDLYFSKVESCYNQMCLLMDNFDEETEIIFVEMSW